MLIRRGQYVDPLSCANEPVNFLNLIDDHSLESTSVSQSLYVNPKVQLHSVCKENDEIYLVSGTALERLFRYFIEVEMFAVVVRNLMCLA